MNVKEFIELLQEFKPDTEVLATFNGKYYEFPNFYSYNGYMRNHSTKLYLILESLRETDDED